jgi:hypothetical protein
MFAWFPRTVDEIFDNIPTSANTYLIGIVAFSFMALATYYLKPRPIGWKLLWLSFIVISTLFTLWRLGLIFYIEDQVTWETTGEFFALIGSVLLVMILGFAFYNKNPWIRKMVLVFLWVMFMLMTWVVAPYSGEMALSYDTLKQTLVIAVLFAFPFLLSLRDAYNDSIDEEYRGIKK